MPWDICGGDPWMTYAEIDAFLDAANQLGEARKKAADEANKAKAKRSRRR